MRLFGLLGLFLIFFSFTMFSFTMVDNNAHALSFGPYQIYRMSINNVDVFDGLGLDSNDQRYFFVTNDSKKIIIIDRNGGFINNVRDTSEEGRIPFNIKSNSPYVLLCYGDQCNIERLFKIKYHILNLQSLLKLQIIEKFTYVKLQDSSNFL